MDLSYGYGCMNEASKTKCTSGCDFHLTEQKGSPLDAALLYENLGLERIDLEAGTY